MINNNKYNEKYYCSQNFVLLNIRSYPLYGTCVYKSLQDKLINIAQKVTTSHGKLNIIVHVIISDNEQVRVIRPFI